MVEGMKKFFPKTIQSKKGPTLDQLWEDLTPKNKERITQFLNYKRNYISEKRLYCIKNHVTRFLWTLNKDVDTASRDEITQVGGLALASTMKDASKRDCFVDVRQAFKFWFGDNEFYPKLVVGLKAPVKKSSIRFPEEMPSEDDIYRYIKALNNSRDKFYFALVGLDGGLRPIEARKIRWQDVKRDDYGHYVIIHTAKKSGDKETRTVRVIKSAPYLRKWIEDYPKERKGEYFVFCNITGEGSQKNVPITGNQVQSIFRRLKKKLNIPGRMYSYQFRHALITRMSKDPRVPISLLKKFIGHTLRSNVIAEYQHFGDEDTKDMQLQYNGIQKDRKIQESVKPIVCPQCQTSNTYDAEVCVKCSFAITQKPAINSNEVDEMKEKIKVLEEALTRRSKADAILNKLLENPKVLEQLERKD